MFSQAAAFAIYKTELNTASQRQSTSRTNMATNLTTVTLRDPTSGRPVGTARCVLKSRGEAKQTQAMVYKEIEAAAAAEASKSSSVDTLPTYEVDEQAESEDTPAYSEKVSKSNGLKKKLKSLVKSTPESEESRSRRRQEYVEDLEGHVALGSNGSPRAHV